MIKFNWVEFSNFLSSGSSPIRIELNEEHTTLIRGGNGTGKTTILDAVNYSLFNRPLRNVKLGQLVNSVNKKKMLVKINFTVSGVTYEVHRGQKPNVFLVYKNGDLVDENAAAKDLQTKLETEILGTNFKTFNQVVVIATTGYTNFMELDTASRRVVVEQMLDIEVIGHMSQLLKDRIKEVRIKSSKLEDNYASVQRSIEEMRRLIEQVKNSGQKSIDDVDRSIAEVDRMIERLTRERELADGELINKENLKPVVDLDAERARYKAAKEELVSIQSMVETIGKEVHDCQLEIRSLESEISSFGRDAKSHENIKAFYTDNDKCDRCNQPIDEQFKKDVVEKMDGHIQDINDKVADRTTQIAQIKSTGRELQEKKRGFDEAINTQNQIVQDVTNMSQQLKTWTNDCDNIRVKLNGIVQRIEDQLKAKARLQEQKNNLLSREMEDTTGYYQKIDEFRADIDELTKIRAEIAEEGELCKLAEMMLKDNGLKAKIIKQFLPVINDTINFYLESMNANYSFVLDEQFNETIKSRYRDTFSYGSFSNGQRMRINLAILFTWRKLAESKNTVASNLLIMDEVLDGSLDKDGIDMLFDIFHTMENANLFVISHRPEIVDRFDKVIEVSLKGNFSNYE